MCQITFPLPQRQHLVGMVSRAALSQILYIIILIIIPLFFHDPLFHVLDLLLFNLKRSHLITFLCGLFVIPALKYLVSRTFRVGDEETEEGGTRHSVYGLQHGRLHVQLPMPMWMNMGYWAARPSHELRYRTPEDEFELQFPLGERDTRDSDDHGTNESLQTPKTLAIASRALLNEVFKTAGFSRRKESSEVRRMKNTIIKGQTLLDTNREFVRSKAILDLGFGCGDQTVYLMSPNAIRKSDKEWYDLRDNVPRLDTYVGITRDEKQFHYAEERVRELRDSSSFSSAGEYKQNRQKITLFCADAANPEQWNNELKEHLLESLGRTDEPWVLALDTLYHFSPSRWPIISYSCRTLNASFMAFDLCLADHISIPNLFLLRILTKLMGAPWANFVTQDEYREKLVEAGYQDITIKDISEHVFAGLATFLKEQDRTLRVIGYGLGPFHLARWMFGWWAQTGIIRGVIVVAKRKSFHK